MGLEDFHTSVLKPEASKEEKLSDKDKEKPNSKEEFIDDVCRVAIMVEDIPTQREYKKHGRYKSWLNRKLFGGWKATIEEAKPKIDRIMKVFILESIEDLRNELGRTPKFSEYKDSGKYSESFIKRYFNGWTEAVNRLGLETHNNYLSDDEELAIAFMLLIDEDEEEIINRFDMDERYKNPRNKIDNIRRGYIPEDIEKLKQISSEMSWVSERVDYNPEELIHAFVRAIRDLEENEDLKLVMSVYNRIFKEHMC